MFFVIAKPRLLNPSSFQQRGLDRVFETGRFFWRSFHFLKYQIVTTVAKSRWMDNVIIERLWRSLGTSMGASNNPVISRNPETTDAA
jgi:hypothetical protein